LQHLPGDIELQTQERAARDHYISILASSLSLIRQQSKMEWLNLGDDNTRIFFTKAKQKKMATFIYSLEDARGSRVKGFDEVGQILLKYYQQLLGPHHAIRNHINPEIIQQGETISQEQQINLCADFTDREIKAAMFSIHKLKSPGPDGYSSGLFHST